MMKLSDIQNFPSKYRSRYTKVQNVRLQGVSITRDGDKLTFNASTITGHTPTVEVQSVKTKTGIPMIRLKSNIRINCSCESFKYEFLYAVGEEGSLIDTDESPVERAKVKNPYSVVSGCKHIIALGKVIARYTGRSLDSLK